MFKVGHYGTLLKVWKNTCSTVGQPSQVNECDDSQLPSYQYSISQMSLQRNSEETFSHIDSKKNKTILFYSKVYSNNAINKAPQSGR